MLLVNQNKQKEKHDNPIEDLVIMYKTINLPERLLIRNEIINQSLNLIEPIVKKYIIHYGIIRYYDDLIGEAQIGLIKGIEEAYDKLEDNNMIGYIKMKIHTQIINYLRKEFKIYSKRILNRTFKNIEIQDHESELLELRDLMNYIIRNDFEWHLLELRSLGYKDIEIAEMFNITTTYVNNVRRRIRKRWNRYEESL